MPINAFCSPDDILELVQMQDGFSAESKPTLAQVQGMITKIAGEVSVAIRRAGYTETITDPVAVEWLKGMNAYGAGALVALVIAGHGNPDEDPLATSLYMRYRERMDTLLAADSPLGVIASEADKPASLQTSQIVDGSNPNYSDNRPMVRRDTQF